MTLHGGSLQIPCVPLGKFMTDRFDEFGDKTALVDPTADRVFTFRSLSSSVRRLTRGLDSIGFKKGDILCMFTPNILEYPVLYYAVVSLGGIIQATNPLYNSRELQHTLDLCKSKYLVTIPPLLSTVRQTKCTAEIIVIGEAKGCISFSSLVSEEFSKEPISDRDIDPKEDVAAILFSSGTTGKPKAVQLTHYALVANTLQLIAHGVLKPTDSYVTFLPFFHIYALGPILTGGLYIGAQNIIMSRFEPTEYLNNLQKYRPTVLNLVPPAMVVLSKLPTIQQYDLSSVTRVTCGAAPLSKDVESRITELFNIPHITQGYGLTECPVSHVTEDGKYSHGSVGTLLPGDECKIVDPETKKILPAGVDGEIYIRGPALMKGYLNNPEATASILNDEGWLTTGDIGHVDKDGFLYIVDRIKELIKYKGFQVAPAELEDVILSHRDIADVGVIGIPDEEAGELPKAFVVRKAGSTITEREIKEFVASKVSGTKRLRGGVTFLSEIPKSPSGKILRRLLRDMEKKRKSKL